MATQTVRVNLGRLSGTYTADVYLDGSNTTFAIDRPLTAESQPGFYTFTLTSSAGLYSIIAKEGGIRIGSGYVRTTDTAATFAAGGTRDEVNAATERATMQSDVTTLLGRITSTLFSGITSLKNWLGSIAGKTADATTLAEINATTAGATYTGITDSLQAIRDRGDAAWGGGGSSLTGANVVTITIDDGTDPVPGALVRVTAGAETDVKRTDASGVVVFSLDDNTWTISATASRLSFTPTNLAITTTTTATYSMDAATPTGDTWATGNDLVVYYDAQTIGQMLKDDKTAVAIGDVPSHAIVEKMLLLATGEVNSALTVSNRYTVEQLATLSDASLEHLKNITCAVAMWHLSERRVPTNPELQESRRKLAESKLERLRKGETALDVAEVREAGVASGIEYVSTETSLLLRDRMSGKAFPYRRTLR